MGRVTKTACLWWTRSYADEKMEDLSIRTVTGEHRLPFEKIQDSEMYLLPAGEMHDSLKERMQAKIERIKDVS